IRTTLPGGVIAAVGIARGWPLSAEPTKPLEAPGAKEARPDGKELFTREWIAGDPRSHQGDGLGPMFNDSSCLACHNQGGIGGGGPASKNVQIITMPIPTNTETKTQPHQ